METIDDFRYDVFLSYSSKDKAVVRVVAERLRKDGLRVWFDEWEVKPGHSIPARIEEGLEHSRVLVLCMSVDAFGSDWAQLESGTFRFRDPLNKERRFIPLRLDDAPIKGSLAQFLYINWLPPDREHEYARLLAACRGDTQFAPTNGLSESVRSVGTSASPTKVVQIVHAGIVHAGTGDIVMGNKTERRPRTKFTPGPEHISPETARRLAKLVGEIVERLTASGGDKRRAFGRVWGDFNAHFDLQIYRELPREKAEEGISYLRQWRASKNSKLRFADPEKFRTAQLQGIWPRSKGLGLTDADLYAFAKMKLKLKSPICSLNDLGNQQLAKLKGFLTYEVRKRERKRDSSRSEIKVDGAGGLRTPESRRERIDHDIRIFRQADALMTEQDLLSFTADLGSTDRYSYPALREIVRFYSFLSLTGNQYINVPARQRATDLVLSLRGLDNFIATHFFVPDGLPAGTVLALYPELKYKDRAFYELKAQECQSLAEAAMTAYEDYRRVVKEELVV